ncbi:MAG: Signal peptidase-like protein [Bacteroidetes bacterium]|nr:Signal peptidase-like protein [Bacteroidota bacterium]
MGCGNGGSCSTACSSRLNVYDWLDNMLPPGAQESQNIYEVHFKKTRKGFYRNTHGLELFIGDKVVVECDRGYDIGTLSIGGEMALLQMKKKKVQEKHAGKILRKATEEDLALHHKLQEKEPETLYRTREMVSEMGLRMKMTDVEYQADGGKAIFFYTAEHRVDFRELIKLLAGRFRIRVEMRQIGMRQEAGMVGGIGACGRELCCSTWLTEFKSVTTGAARYQNISLNPAKITGLCGRLKCCLNFELEAYLDALKGIPSVREIQTELGKAYLQKTDIFRGHMWFSYGGESNWTMVPAERVQELVRLNKRGIKPPSLLPPEEESTPKVKATDFVDVVGQSDLHTRMASHNRKRGVGKKKRSGGPRPHSKPGA